MLSPNPWLAIASASPLQSTAPAGILSRPPPTPDPPDPNHFPPLSAARSPSKRSKSHIPPSKFLDTVHQKLTTSASPSEISPTVPLPQSTTVLPSSSTSQLLASFIHSPFSNSPGHLMKNCPKGHKDWVQISRKKKHTCSMVDEPKVGSQQTPSDSLPKEPSDHQSLPVTSISIDPDTATDVLTNDLGTVLPPPVPASMDIDSPPPPLPSVSLDTNLVSSTSSITIPPTEPISPPHLTNCVLGLAAVCPPRPVIPNNHLTTPKISFTSLNPFQLLSPPGNSLQLSPPNSPRTSPITSPKSPAKVPTFEIISASPSLDPSPLPVTPSSPTVLNSDQSANDLHLPHPEAGTTSI
ncbi:hypothetical protein F2Q68_00016987 [Brassica cretica]|uniref:Uncharacterized protein n=1 Tax=Brassica cretica TaxID=69181 RepID=A0A8S9HHW8_BRACR|nr:hypothetical protein F2Q68_00016987 [Brassica cretica]